MPLNFESRTVTRTQEVLVGASCDGCGTALEPLFGVEEALAVGLFKNALKVTIHGCYGEYIDGGSSIILCRSCAFKLEDVEVLASAFQEAREQNNRG